MAEAIVRRQAVLNNGHVIATQAWLRMPERAGVRAPKRRRTSALAGLMAGISTGAAVLAFMATPAPVRAQGVVGTPDIQFGIETVLRDSGTKTDTVVVIASEALLDWNATSSTGVFLPEGNTLRFDGGGEDYTVLNRVTSSQFGGPLSIAGRVESESNGKVWFYNPGGWVVGSTGVFDVGSLVLTSSPITVDPATDTVSRLFGDNGEIRFGAAPDPASSVTIAGGAQINANSASGSYVAMVAPRVSQGGTVRVDGSVAYVGAEAATITINNGLFDIVVDSGSDDSTGVSHTGTTTGPAANFSDPNHRIYLVAVPKNQAMTAVVSGSLGYAAATNAQFDIDGSIILSAGYNVAGQSVPTDTPVGANASLSIEGLTATNDISGYASGTIAVDATTADVAFAGNAYLWAAGDLNVDIGTGRALTVGRTLDLRSTSTTASGDISVDLASGASLAVTGDLNAVSTAIGLVKRDPNNGDVLEAGSVGDDVRSGNVSIVVRDADFFVDGDTVLMSEATGGIGQLSVGTAQAGNVGFAALQDNPNSPARQVSLASVQLTSVASAAYFSQSQIPLAGASSIAGDVTFAVDGGLHFADRMTLDSSANASFGSDLAPQQASAGWVEASFANSVDTFLISSLGLSNSASASEGGGVALGDVALSLDNADVTITDGLYGYLGISSNAYGALATPNTVGLSLVNGAALDLGQGYLALNAYAYGEIGEQTSGTIAITIDGSSLSLGSFQAYTTASAANDGSDATGGDIALALRNGATLDALYSVGLYSYGYGANGDDGVDGGDGIGGDVSFVLDASTFAASNFDQRSIGTAGYSNGDGGASGAGRGGTTSFRQTGSTSSFEVGSFQMDAMGTANSGEGGLLAFSSLALGTGSGDGADGFGGTASFTVENGLFTVNDLQIMANGEGGNGANFAGFDPGNGGNGTGGTASLVVSGGIVTANSLEISAAGLGGDGADHDDYTGVGAGNGGNGTGGNASATLTGGLLVSDEVTISANGNQSIDYGYGYTRYYGNGGGVYYADGTAGAGGIGQGGTALLTIDGGGLQDAADPNVTNLSVLVQAIGEGGAGGETYSDSTFSPYLANSGSGGAGIGGSAGVSYLSGDLDAASVAIVATGLGGFSGNQAYGGGESAVLAGSGGSGTGGTATFAIGTDFSDLTSSDDLRLISLNADGIGRAGEAGQTGGAGGNGTGGSAIVNAIGGFVTLNTPALSAVGSAGNGGNSTLDQHGGAGGNAQGGSIEILSDGFEANLTLSGNAIAAWGRGGSGGDGGNGSDLVDGAGSGGAGGSGTGGSVSFIAANFGQLDVSAFVDSRNLAVEGLGGDGGLGGNASANGWTSTGQGGAGGSGTGGSIAGRAEDGGALAFGIAAFDASGVGGAGGDLSDADVDSPLKASAGASGGSGTGGTISLITSGPQATLSIGSLLANANGYGGNAASGAGNDLVTGLGASGGAGGAATGGSIQLLAEYSGRLDVAEPGGGAELNANAFGGDGGTGVSAIFNANGNGGNGGTGGNSGTGLGGSISIAANSTGTVNLAPTDTTLIFANGDSGLAGIGGDGSGVNTSDPDAIGGNGGNAGRSLGGRGGVVSFSADGGELVAGALEIDAIGTTYFNFAFSSGGFGPGGSGQGGSATVDNAAGGTVTFASFDDLDGNIGNLVAGSTDVDVTSATNYITGNGDFLFANDAGSIILRNFSHPAGDTMRFASFTGNATGTGGAQPGIVIDAFLSPITIDGALTLEASGIITVDMFGSAGLTVGGTAVLRSDSGIFITGFDGGQFNATDIDLGSFGSIDIASVNCPDATCAPVHASGSLRVDANFNFNLYGPANAAGLGSVDVYAGNDITGDSRSGYFSNGNVLVRGGNDVTVRNAYGNNIAIAAGAVVDGQTFYYPATLTLGEVEGGGEIRADGTASFASGGGIFVTEGNVIESATAMDFASGNDIVVDGNNLIAANASQPANPGGMRFRAGGLAVNHTLEPSDIAALSFGGGTSVDSNNGTITLSGAAIDARQATFFGNGLQADVTSLIALGDERRDDGGRLDPDCLDGAICIGEIFMDGNVAIGQGSASPRDVRLAGAISGSTVRIRALGDITAGDLESQVFVSGTANATIASTQGDIALLGGSTVNGGSVALSGAGSLTGTGHVESFTDDVGLTFGGDIDAGSITAARQLTTAAAIGGAPEASFTTPGSLRVDALSLGTGSAATNARINAGGDIMVGTLKLGGNSGALDAVGTIALGSTFLADVDDLSLSAETIDFGALTVLGDLSLNGSTVTGFAAEAVGTLDVTADDLTVGFLRSLGNLTLTVVNTAALGTVESHSGSVFIDPALLTFDAISAAGAISLAGGTITGGTVDAGTTLDIVGTGPLSLISASAGSSLAIAAASLTAPSLSAVGNIALTIGGPATLGTATAGQALTITAGDITFDALSGTGVNITGADVLGQTITGSMVSIRSTTGGDVTFESVNSAGLARVAGGAVSGGTVVAGTSAELSGATLDLGSVRAGGAISYSGGAIDIAETVAGGSVLVDAGSFTFDSIRAGGNADVVADGSVIGGTVNAPGLVRFNVGGQLRYATLDGGDIFLRGASIAGGNIRARGGSGRSGEINIGTTGALTVAQLDATGSVGIDAGSLAFDTIKAGAGFATNNRSMTGNAITAKGDVSINTNDDLSLASISGADFDLSSNGAINLASITATGEVTAQADAVSLTSPGALRIRLIDATNGNVDVTAAGTINGDTINARGDIALRSTGADVSIRRLSAGYADVFSDAVRPQANVVPGVIGQGDIVIDALRDIQIDTTADAANAFVANAGGTIRLNGLATGKTMALSSADIAIASTGQLGESSHTDDIVLSNAGQSVTRLGDAIASQTSVYALGQAEFARIQSRGNLSIGGGSAMLVGDLAATAQSGTTAGQIGQTGRLSLQSSGLVSFLGAVSLANAAGNTLSVDGSDGVFLDATTGSIRLTEGQARGGTLRISGSGIAMVTRDALEDISALTDTAAITERLSANDGVTADRTLIEAEVIDLQSDREVYVQNTAVGTGFAERRGFVAGSLSIDSRDGGTLDIVINGTVDGATGIDAIDLIDLEEEFTPLSSVNGCVIANVASCGVEPVEEPPVFDQVIVRDVIAEVLDDNPEDTALQVADSFTRSTLIQINQIAPAGFEPLIDEPVTGTGNDDLLGDDEEDE
ncbi:hypothetical protein [Novosphingobium sp. CECT 9465]|uniref:hypothetical protein n=1 Tax=Novosphingobium sp. CECT 9465 TaxID=2829794 RepID=UPI001E37170F|nr:hypothetical protein [Novosphingobium sp. CECT 9465]CAH0497118.1 hypothetical protein NVSP9465_02170 [Novosphingobium sp. CECT 9465]